MKKNNVFTYFLNAIHYSLWKAEMKFGYFMEKVVNGILSPILKYTFKEKYRKQYYECLQNNKKDIDNLFHDKKYGYHVGWANHWFGFFYSGYPLFLSFAFGGLLLRNMEYLNTIIKLAILVIPIGLCYIPAYKAVFAKDHYVGYFKQFEKMDKQWHRKWAWITLAFCLGSIVSTIIGILVMFTIAIS